MTAGSVYVSRIGGGRISEAEVRRVLRNYGPIESLWFSSQTEREMYQLPEGAWVKFAYYQGCRDAAGVGSMASSSLPLPGSPLVQALRDDALYRLEQPSMDKRGSLSNAPAHGIAQDHWANGDRCAIFIGGLHPGTTRESLENVFNAYGELRGIDVVVKPSATREFSLPSRARLLKRSQTLAPTSLPLWSTPPRKRPLGRSRVK